MTLKSAGPFLVLTFIYFIVGFLTTVNGQCQGPLKIAFLSEVTDLKNSLATLISFAFFLGYLLNSQTAGKMLDKVGYKTTLIRSLLVMVTGLALYLSSALCAEFLVGKGIHLGSDFVPFGYFVFLLGSFDGNISCNAAGGNKPVYCSLSSAWHPACAAHELHLRRQLIRHHHRAFLRHRHHVCRRTVGQSECQPAHSAVLSDDDVHRSHHMGNVTHAIARHRGHTL